MRRVSSETACRNSSAVPMSYRIEKQAVYIYIYVDIVDIARGSSIEGSFAGVHRGLPRARGRHIE